ncbi:hypothetical protein [Kribbella sp. CA-293567]|uniref:hypothetical protein n=1 Tax=Kribbella sp. CA-293567 TaxID=3002436 RepID=UPI0022DD4662|nr:hypothetical protein [Kribbella sp. CA-293567]WBQ04372.1 hypothetical protein OX958_30960 [Kribbella sp. CA-293567]
MAATVLAVVTSFATYIYDREESGRPDSSRITMDPTNARVKVIDTTSLADFYVASPGWVPGDYSLASREAPGGQTRSQPGLAVGLNAAGPSKELGLELDGDERVLDLTIGQKLSSRPAAQLRVEIWVDARLATSAVIRYGEIAALWAAVLATSTVKVEVSAEGAPGTTATAVVTSMHLRP